MKISVIVPIYNVDRFLSKCLDSLANQTLKDIEIILVNDGATDNSRNIACEYVARYQNFQLIDKENGGLSSARNAGLDVAKGEYIAFIDSDDWVSEDMMEKLWNSAKKYQSDIVMSGYFRAFDDGKELELHGMQNFKNFYEGDEVYKAVFLKMLGGLPNDKNDIQLDMCVWKNLYRRELIEQNHIRFKSERVYLSEDIVFHTELFKHIKRASIVDKSMYFYRLNSSSLTQNFKKDIFDKQFFLYNYLKQELIKAGWWKDAELRLKRLFIGRNRNKLSEYVKGSGDSLWDKWKFTRMTLNRSEMKDLFKKYPVQKLRGKLLLATIPMQRSWSLLFMLMSFVGKR